MVRQAKNLPRGVMACEIEFLERPFKHARDGRRRGELMVVVNTVERHSDMDMTTPVTVDVATVMNAAITEPVVMLLGILLVLNHEMVFVMAFRRDGLQKVSHRRIVWHLQELRFVVFVSVDVEFDVVWHGCWWFPFDAGFQVGFSAPGDFFSKTAHQNAARILKLPKKSRKKWCPRRHSDKCSTRQTWNPHL